MTPQDMVARYAQDVARRLPKRMRADVHAELQALLMDSLRERANGGAATEAMATELLMSFGAPRDVALRYHAPSAIIEPADTRLFMRLTTASLGGFALFMISAALSAPHSSIAEWQAMRDRAELEYVTLALKILGLLVAAFWALGALRRRYPQWGAWSPRKLPRVADPDHANRGLYLLAAMAGALGTLSLVNPVWFLDVFLGGHPPTAVVRAFAYDPDFTRVRGPLLFSALGLSLLLLVWVAIEGRWREQTRRISLGLSLVICVIMAWGVLAGAVFQSPPTDQFMKLAMALCSTFGFADAWSKRDRFGGGSGGFNARQQSLPAHDGI